MMPVNTKSLFAILCKTLEQLESEEIDVATANSKAKVIGQAINMLNYELKRAIIASNPEISKFHRVIELKSFDSLSE